MMAATLISRLLGLVRDQVIAYQLGVGVETDAYTAAFKVADLLMYLVAGGALSSTFVPIFKEYLHKNQEKQAWRMFSVVATVTVVVATILVGIIEVFPEPFIRILNSGYDESRVRLTVPLVRIITPAQIFFMLGGLLMGTLNARGRFLTSAIAPSVYNLGIIFGAAVLYPTIGLTGLTWGALLGAVAGSFFLQIGPVIACGMRFRASLNVFDPGAVKVWKMLLPILLGVSLPNVDQIINGAFASTLPPGSQSAMQYAVRLMLIPIGIFAQAMGVALLPSMSGHAAAGHMTAFRSTVNKAIRIIFFLTIPASALLAILAVPCIRVLFEHGHFNDAATLLTAVPLRYYSIGICAWSAQAILTRGFYALQDSRTPVITGTIMTVLFIAMNWYIVNGTDWGIGGLAASTSAAAALHAVVMYALLRRRVKGLLDWRLMVAFAKIMVATLALAITTRVLCVGMDEFLPSDHVKLRAFMILVIAGGAGVAAFIGAARGLKMRELREAIAMLRRQDIATQEP